jgi:predicted house-cleaning noncanonical NTP pyrophosphatase (MazG superfamily)
MKEINKLVRDNVPELIEKEGYKVVYEILDKDAFFESLKRKLREETNEFTKSNDYMELFDVLDVVETLLSLKFDGKQKEYDNFLNDVSQKKLYRGGFDKRIFLRGIEKS